MGQKNIVIFDLDGTLLNSICDISSCCNKALALEGFPTHAAEEYRSMVGWGADNLIHKALPPGSDNAESFRRVRRNYEEIYLEVCKGGCTMFDGVRELLEWLHSFEVLTGVVSNKPQSQTDAVCRSTFGRLLDGWQGQRVGIPIKPDPAGIFLLAEKLGGHCIAYVGDSNVDIETGTNAEVPTIGVSWGMQPRSCLTEAGAGLIADHIWQLRYILLDIIAREDYHN